jgi:hypothetical protein
MIVILSSLLIALAAGVSRLQAWKKDTRITALEKRLTDGT